MAMVFPNPFPPRLLSNLACVQTLALSGQTFFTMCTPSSSLRWGGPRKHSRTLRLRREMSFFSTSSLTPCFFNHVTLLVSFPLCRCTRLFFFFTDVGRVIVIQARDAWIQADANRYGGSHTCVLWQTFASRGLGVNATTSYTDDITFPPECDC